eukprot:3588680-Pyramimonas_sp.AAC.2
MQLAKSSHRAPPRRSRKQVRMADECRDELDDRSDEGSDQFMGFNNLLSRSPTQQVVHPCSSRAAERARVPSVVHPCSSRAAERARVPSVVHPCSSQAAVCLFVCLLALLRFEFAVDRRAARGWRGRSPPPPPPRSRLTSFARAGCARAGAHAAAGQGVVLRVPVVHLLWDGATARARVVEHVRLERGAAQVHRAPPQRQHLPHREAPQHAGKPEGERTERRTQNAPARSEGRANSLL